MTDRDWGEGPPSQPRTVIVVVVIVVVVIVVVLLLLLFLLAGRLPLRLLRAAALPERRRCRRPLPLLVLLVVVLVVVRDLAVQRSEACREGKEAKRAVRLCGRGRMMWWLSCGEARLVFSSPTPGE